MKRKYIASGLIAGLTAGAGAGFLLEQSGSAGAAGVQAVTVATDTATADTTDATTVTTTVTDPATDAATDPATDAADDDGGPGDGTTFLTGVLQPLVDAGTITQAQADAVIAAIDAARPAGGGMHGPGGRGGARLDTIATALGMTADELRTALEAGTTLRAVATSKGVDPQVVVDAIVAEAKTHLDAEVTAGDLTQAEADTKLADVTTAATALLDSTAPVGGPGMGGPGMGGPGMGGHMGGRHGGPGRPDDDADDAAGATTTTTATTTATTTG